MEFFDTIHIATNVENLPQDFHYQLSNYDQFSLTQKQHIASHLTEWFVHLHWQPPLE